MIVLLAIAAACLPVNGDRITAGDIAEAVPAFAALQPAKVISYAPLPGHTRVFPTAELRQRLPDATELPESVCFEWPMRALSPDELRLSMLSALPAGATVSIGDYSRQPAPPGALRFPLEGLRNGRWSGFVEWAPGRQFIIWARVDVQVAFSRVVALEPIRAGQRIERAAVRLETGTGEPLPPGLATGIDEVVGRVPRRLIPAGTAIPLASVDREVTVARGDPVHVKVIAGATALAFDGIAEGRGAVGELVPVRNPATKRLVHARVEARGLAVASLNTGEATR